MPERIRTSDLWIRSPMVHLPEKTLHPRQQSARHRGLGDDEAAMLGGSSALAVLKWVLSRCLKRCKAVQKCDKFETPR